MTRTHAKGPGESKLVRPGNKQRRLTIQATQEGLTTRQAETIRRLKRLRPGPAVPADLPLASRGKKHAATRYIVAALESDIIRKRAGRSSSPPSSHPDLN